MTLLILPPDIVILPPEPLVLILLARRLPVTSRFPETLAPVEVTTNTLALPPTEVLTLPPATGTLTFELPLAILEVPTVPQLRLPAPSVFRY